MFIKIKIKYALKFLMTRKISIQFVYYDENMLLKFNDNKNILLSFYVFFMSSIFLMY